MSRLARWFGKISGSGVKGRKQARFRAYRSTVLAGKMRLVKKECRRQGKQG